MEISQESHNSSFHQNLDAAQYIASLRSLLQDGQVNTAARKRPVVAEGMDLVVKDAGARLTKQRNIIMSLSILPDTEEKDGSAQWDFFMHGVLTRIGHLIVVSDRAARNYPDMINNSILDMPTEEQNTIIDTFIDEYKDINGWCIDNGVSLGRLTLQYHPSLWQNRAAIESLSAEFPEFTPLEIYRISANTPRYTREALQKIRDESKRLNDIYGYLVPESYIWRLTNANRVDPESAVKKFIATVQEQSQKHPDCPRSFIEEIVLNSQENTDDRISKKLKGLDELKIKYPQLTDNARQYLIRAFADPFTKADEVVKTAASLIQMFDSLPHYFALNLSLKNRDPLAAAIKLHRLAAMIRNAASEISEERAMEIAIKSYYRKEFTAEEILRGIEAVRKVCTNVPAYIAALLVLRSPDNPKKSAQIWLRRRNSLPKILTLKQRNELATYESDPVARARQILTNATILCSEFPDLTQRKSISVAYKFSELDEARSSIRKKLSGQADI